MDGTTVTWLIERRVGDMRPGDHAWLAFANGDEREHVVGTFVHDGLQTEEKVVYVTDASPDELPGVLRHRIDPARFTEAGQLRLISRVHACLKGGRFDPDRMLRTLEREIAIAFDEGYRAVRITTDMSWALSEPRGSERLLGCEGWFEAAVAPSTMAMAICQINPRRCTPDQLIALRNTHEVLVKANPAFDDGILAITRTFEPHGLCLEGELDGARHAVFAETLSSVTAAGRQVHLDFTKLRFIDLGALNLLAHHALRLPAGSTLILDNVPTDVANVIEMVGWDRFPGLAHGSENGNGNGAPS
jgi:anti-anti-sigma regulatory factor